MISTRVLEELKCCLHGLPEHFVKDPKFLSCGHPVCQKCIEYTINDEMKCSRCNQVNSLDLDTVSTVSMAETMIESQLEHLSKALYSQILNAENAITGFKNDLENKIKIQFDVVSTNIETTIESLKAKLDLINDSLQAQIEESKKKVKKLLFDPIDEIKEKTEVFNQDIQRNSFNLATFYDNNSNLLNIGLLLDKLKKFNLEVKFDFDEKFRLDEDSIGSLSCNIDDEINKRLIYVIERGKPEYIELDFEPNSIFELKNKNILVGSFADNLLALYDSEFKLIRKLTEINDEIIIPYGLDCDQNGNVFVTNGFDSLYKLDSEFKLIKAIRFDGCCGNITIHENKIFICGGKCVRVYSLDLDKISEHYVEDHPMHIRITSDMACIQFMSVHPELKQITRFYKFPSFELVIEHDLAGPILAHNAMFYLYHQDGTGFTVFDKNGKILKEIEKSLGETFYYDYGMRFLNNALYICLKNRICKIVH